MAKHILGLDIGKSSVKAVLVEAGLRGSMRIVAWEKVDIAAGGGIGDALRRLQEIPVLTVPTCQTALAAGGFSFRNVRLPFKDRKKILQTLPFELESQIPHAVEDVLIDFTVIAQAEGSEIFTAVIPKTDVQERATLLAEHGFDADAIDIDTVPVAARLMAEATADVPCLLLDVGAAETTGIFFKAGKILQIRSFPFGGGDITAALSGALGIPVPEAEARKKRGDTGLAEQEITAACQKFFASLKNTMSSLRMSGVIAEEVATVYVTGGGSLYRKLVDDLSQALTVPVERVNVTALAGIKPVGGDDDGWDSMIMNGALALALRPLAKGPGFNFHQGGFRRKGMALTFDLGVDVKWAAAVAAFILLLAGGDFFLSYLGDKTRLDQLKAETTALFQSNFPEVTRIVDPVQQFRSKIAEAKRLATASRNAASGGSVLGVMKDLSERAPEASGFSMTSLVFDGSKVDIRGEATGFDAAETIKKELETTGRYESISVSSSNVKQGNRVEFELKTTLAKKP
ncbi:MAG TPA: type II secretion system protein GspL [Syntrophales bacterium]|nr:type II secretion system protein GspL [Syntrophales bacterium]